MANKVIQRIDGIIKHIDTIYKEMREISFDDFKKQSLLADAISFNLAQIGESWNKGYATEAAQELIRHAFEDLKIKRIWCGYYDGNERSKHVQEKLGFKFHHLTNDVEVPQLKTFRKGYSNLLSEEDWESNN